MKNSFQGKSWQTKDRVRQRTAAHSAGKANTRQTAWSTTNRTGKAITEKSDGAR